MRAHEFIDEVVNDLTLKPGFERTQNMGDYTLRAYYDKAMGPEPHLRVDAIDRSGKIVGSTYFQPRTQTGQLATPGPASASSHLEALATKVDPAFQRQGVASSMYNFARRLGNQIKPSTLAQTPAGKDFWARGGGGIGQINKVPAQPDVPGAVQPQPASPTAPKPQTIDVTAKPVPSSPQSVQLKPAPGTAAGVVPGSSTMLGRVAAGVPPQSTPASPGPAASPAGVAPGPSTILGRIAAGQAAGGGAYGGGAFAGPGPKFPFPGKVM